MSVNLNIKRKKMFRLFKKVEEQTSISKLSQEQIYEILVAELKETLSEVSATRFIEIINLYTKKRDETILLEKQIELLEEVKKKSIFDVFVFVRKKIREFKKRLADIKKGKV